MHYVYKLINNKITVPLYVGITENPERRFYQHKKTNHHIWTHVKSLLGDEEDVEMKIIATCKNIEHARIFEREWIAIYSPPFNIQYNDKFIFHKEMDELIKPFSPNENCRHVIIDKFLTYLCHNQQKVNRLIAVVNAEYDAIAAAAEIDEGEEDWGFYHE